MPPLRPLLRVLPLLLIALALAACGNKGPLVKPQPAPSQSQPAPASSGH
jgi:predicted small lipoprotein YifL